MSAGPYHQSQTWSDTLSHGLIRYAGYITEQAGEDPQPEVHIAVDKFAQYAKVAGTLADLQSRGLKKIGFINNTLY
jgi:biopolymer transport protein ExbD